MESTNGMLLSGQWYSSYTYGNSYDEKVDGERVDLSFLLKMDGDGELHGKCIELEGIGESMEVSVIRGSFDGRTTRFKKEHETNIYINEDGAVYGHAGDWEIRANSAAPDILYGSGKW